MSTSIKKFGVIGKPKTSKPISPYFSPSRIIENETKRVRDYTSDTSEEICYSVAAPFPSENAEKNFYDYQQEYHKTLKRAQLEMLHNYKGNDHNSINNQLRFNDSQKWSQQDFSDLDSVLKFAPTFNFSIFTYRVVGLQELKVILEDVGYKSTSLRSTYCFSFGTGKRIFLQIKIKRNTPVFLMDIKHNFRSGESEAEILLPRTARFEIVDPIKEVNKQFSEFILSSSLVFFLNVEAIY